MPSEHWLAENVIVQSLNIYLDLAQSLVTIQIKKLNYMCEKCPQAFTQKLNYLAISTVQE